MKIYTKVFIIAFISTFISQFLMIIYIFGIFKQGQSPLYLEVFSTITLYSLISAALAFIIFKFIWKDKK